jgi:hypothetical protein
MTGTTIIITIIIIIITEEKLKIYCSEGSQVVPARPSGKSRLEERQSVGGMMQVRRCAANCSRKEQCVLKVAV